MGNLAIVEDTGRSLEELMGVTYSSTSTSGPSLARITQIHLPKMGEIEVNGKKIKTEVLPVGSFSIYIDEDTTLYANTVTIRLFAKREKWQRWNSEKEVMEKSVLGIDLKSDLKDNTGRYNLGRPAGYIPNWNELPDETKAEYRTISRVVVLMGLATFQSLDKNGEEKGEVKDIPFIMDLKNRDSIKAIETSLKSLQKKKQMSIMTDLLLSGDQKSIPSGATYGVIKSALTNAAHKITIEDQDTLKDFVEYIEWSNGIIIDAHNEVVNGTVDEDIKTVVDTVRMHVEEEENA